jgi:hypothetical protein
VTEPIVVVTDLFSTDPPDWPEVAHLADRGAYDEPWYAERVTPEGFRSVIGRLDCSVCGMAATVPCLGSKGRWIHAGRQTTLAAAPARPRAREPVVPPPVAPVIQLDAPPPPRPQESRPQSRPLRRPLQWDVARERALQRLASGKTG